MRAALVAVALLALTASALASLPLGDNGMTTYTGRKREPNTMVFGNQMVVDQGVNAMLELTKQVLTGTVKAVPNDPATEKTEVSFCCRCCCPRVWGWLLLLLLLAQVGQAGPDCAAAQDRGRQPGCSTPR